MPLIANDSVWFEMVSVLQYYRTVYSINLLFDNFIISAKQSVSETQPMSWFCHEGTRWILAGSREVTICRRSSL